MAITKAELGGRIREVRRELGMTQAALAAIIEDLDQTKLSRIECGDRGVTSLELADLADALHVDPADLLDERPLRLAVAARAEHDNLTATCDVALRRAHTLARVRRVLADASYPAPVRQVAPLPAGSGREIDKGRRLAQKVRTMTNIGTAPIHDLAEFAEDHFGLAVVEEPFGTGFDGLCIDDYGQALAVVNTSTYGGRQRFTLAHELAHHLLADFDDGAHIDKDIYRSKGSLPEIRANVFAAHLLLPFEAVDVLAEDGPVQVADAVRLGFDHGLSVDALAHHLSNHASVPDNVVDLLRHSTPRTLAEKGGVLGRFEDLAAMQHRRDVSPQLAASMNDAHAAGLVGSGLVSDLFGLDADLIDADRSGWEPADW